MTDEECARALLYWAATLSEDPDSDDMASRVEHVAKAFAQVRAETVERCAKAVFDVALGMGVTDEECKAWNEAAARIRSLKGAP